MSRRLSAVVLLLLLATAAPAALASAATTGPAQVRATEEPSAPPAAGAGIDAYNPYGAYTTPFLDTGRPPSPTIAGSGADALIRGPDLQGTSQPTLLERYGGGGHSLDTGTGFGEGDRALNSLAGGLFAIATWLAQTAVAVVQWAFTIEVFDFIGDAVAAIVGTLEGLLYSPFVLVAVILAGGSMAWHGLIRRRSSIATEQMVWTVAALVVAGLFFAAPDALVNGANRLSTGLARGVLAGVSVVDPQTGPADGLTLTPTFEGNAADDELRVAGDRFWRVFIHQPWLVLQFGDPETGRRFGERLLAAKVITTEELAATAADPEALTALTEAKGEAYRALEEEILADPRAAEWFRGQRAVERVGVSTLALAGVTVGGLLMVLVAAAALLTQVAFLLLVLLGPLALLIGIHPGTGRVLALRWGSLLAGLLLKRIAVGTLLAVILVINGVLLDAAYPLGWLVVMGLQTLVVAAAVAYRKPFTQLLGPTTVPAVAGGALSGLAAAPLSGGLSPAPGAAHGSATVAAVAHSFAEARARALNLVAPRRERRPSVSADPPPDDRAWTPWQWRRPPGRHTAAPPAGNGHTARPPTADVIEHRRVGVGGNSARTGSDGE